MTYTCMRACVSTIDLPGVEDGALALAFPRAAFFAPAPGAAGAAVVAAPLGDVLPAFAADVELLLLLDEDADC